MNHNTDSLHIGGPAQLQPPVATGTSAPRQYHFNFQDPKLLPAVWPQHWPGPSFLWVEEGLQKAMQVAGVFIGHTQLGFGVLQGWCGEGLSPMFPGLGFTITGD